MILDHGQHAQIYALHSLLRCWDCFSRGLYSLIVVYPHSINWTKTHSDVELDAVAVMSISQVHAFLVLLSLVSLHWRVSALTSL